MTVGLIYDPYFYANEALRVLYARLGIAHAAEPPLCDACGGRHWPEPGDER